MAQDPSRLIWIDMEMSGLDPDTDKVLEVAIVITDTDLQTVAEAPVLVVHQPDSVLDAMDAWNKNAHGTSGLIQRVKSSTLCEHDVQRRMVQFLADYVPPGVSPMCGNSVHQDRRFMARHLPELESYFLYRNLDVSTLKELAKRWRKDLSGLAKHGKHEALADIHESIEELRYYRDRFLRMNP